MVKYNLVDLVNENIPGMTDKQLAYDVEACRICFDRHSHTNAVLLDVYKNGTLFQQIELDWDDSVDDKMRKSWSDLQDATESGATAIAVLVIIKHTKYSIIERAVKGTGFDYWLLEKEKLDPDDIIPWGSARLEVSGIMHAKEDKEINTRINSKKKQVDRSNTSLPAYIVVTEFSRPVTHMVVK